MRLIQSEVRSDRRQGRFGKRWVYLDVGQFNGRAADDRESIK